MMVLAGWHLHQNREWAITIQKATLLITEYLEALNNKENTNKFTLEIRDLTDKQGEAIGTRVALAMPLIYLEQNIL